jgi:hypothetical protein
MSEKIIGSKIVEVKAVQTVSVTVEGVKTEKDAQLDFTLVCPATIEELTASLQEASEPARAYFFSMLESNMTTRAKNKAGRYLTADAQLHVPKEIGLDWAFGVIETGRFSYRKTAELFRVKAEEARKESMELPELLASGALELSSFLEQHAELKEEARRFDRKAAEMDAKADEEAAERKPRTKRSR